MRRAVLLASACVALGAQSFPLETMAGLRANKVTATPVEHKGKKGIRLTEPAGASGSNEDRLLLLPVKDF